MTRANALCGLTLCGLTLCGLTLCGLTLSLALSTGAEATGAEATELIAPEVSRLLVLFEGDEAERSYAVEELRLLGDEARPALELLLVAGTSDERALARELLGRPASPEDSVARRPGAPPEPVVAPPPQPESVTPPPPIASGPTIEQIAGWHTQLRDPNPHTRWGAVSELGSHQVTDSIAELVAGLVRCRDDSGDWHVFWRTLWALNNMPQPEVAVPLMREELRSAATWRDRWNAAVGLCYLRVDDPDAIAVLHGTLDDERPRLELRAFSITSLSYAGNDGLFAVADRFFADRELRLRRATLDALRHWSATDPRRIAAILRMIDDPSPEVRWRAAMHLGRHRTDAVVAGLRARLAIETDDNVRNHLQRSLTKFGDPPGGQ